MAQVDLRQLPRNEQLFLGAGALVFIASFLPWYGVSITASGAASAQQALATEAQQYGNASFQAGVSMVGAEFSSLAGRLSGIDLNEAIACPVITAAS